MPMQASELPRAIGAATSIAAALDLAVDDAIVLHDSNRLTLRLLPCDVLARVAQAGNRTAPFEVDLETCCRGPVGVRPRNERRTTSSMPSDKGHHGRP